MDGKMRGNDVLIGMLKSKTVGQKLIVLLWIGLALSILSCILSLSGINRAHMPLFGINLPHLTYSFYYTQLRLICYLVSLFFTLIYLVTIIFFLIWLYRLHFDLPNLFQDYPISPSGSLARFIIPIYNLWGMWSTYATLSKYFKKETEPTIAHAGKKLKFWLPLLYIVIILQPLSFDIWITPGFIFASSMFTVFLIVVWLQIARIIHSGMNNLIAIRQR